MGRTDLATYSNTGQAVDKWTAESVRELVMDCSRRGHADGDGCWHIEGEPQHWQRLADELNRVTAEATAEEGSSRVPVGSSTWTVKKVCELLERNTYADGRTTEYDSLGNGYEVNVYSTDYQAIADELNEHGGCAEGVSGGNRMTKEEQQPLVGDVCANCKYGRYILDPTEPGYWWCDNPWTDGRVDCDHTCPRWKPRRMKRKKTCGVRKSHKHPDGYML